MIETHRSDLALVSGSAVVTVDFSTRQDPRWTGVIALPPYARLPLEKNVRNDIYVLSGELTEHGMHYSSDTFLSRFEATQLYAGSQGALLLIYRDRIATSHRDKTILNDDLEWYAGGATGMQVASLCEEHHHRVMLVSWQPGTRMHVHAHPFGEEIFVLEGELRDAYGCHVAGTWQRFHPGTSHAPYAEIKTRILLRNGHLKA